jgi:hypothetical protein
MTAWNTTHDVYIAQLVKPEVVHSVCRQKEVPFGQLFVDLVSRRVQPIEDPLFHKALISGGLDWNQNCGELYSNDFVPSKKPWERNPDRV